MKILTICRKGNVRSVALARRLKQEGHDVIASGVLTNSPETLALLAKWADKIVVMRAGFEEFLPRKYRGRVHIMDIGIDIWKNPRHPDLMEIIENRYEEIYTI